MPCPRSKLPVVPGHAAGRPKEATASCWVTSCNRHCPPPSLLPRVQCCAAAVMYAVLLQGLLPLSRRTVLTARLVCKRWQESLSQDIKQITLPYDAWGTTSQSSSSSARLASSSAAVDQTGWRTAATAAAAALAAVRDEVGLDEAAEAGAPRPKRARNSKASNAQQAQAAAAAASILPGSSLQQIQQHLEVPELQQEQGAAGATATATKLQDSQPIEPSPAAAQQAGAAGQPVPPAAGASRPADQQQQAGQQAHPLLQLPASFPACTQVTLSNKRSPWYDPGAPSGSAAVAEAVTLLGQLPKLDSLCVQGYMPAADWQPLLSALAGPRQQQEQQQELQVDQHAEGMDAGFRVDPSTATDAMASDASARDQPQQTPMPQLKQQQLFLRARLVTLDLQSLELPPPLLLEAVLAGLQGLRTLNLHASMESILEVRLCSGCFEQVPVVLLLSVNLRMCATHS